MNVITRFFAGLRLREAVKQANAAFEKTGERHYVMPMSGNSGKLIIMDRYNFRKLKHKGYIKPNVFVRDLERECFYCTSYRNGSGRLPAHVIAFKGRQYFEWRANIKKPKRTFFAWFKSLFKRKK